MNDNNEKVTTIREWIDYWRWERKDNSARSIKRRLKAFDDTLDLMETMIHIIEETANFDLTGKDYNFFSDKMTHLEESFREITIFSRLDGE